MAVFHCKSCGAPLEVQEGMTVCKCEYCETTQTVSKFHDENILNLYDRANHFRRNNDYDKAITLYEQILNIDNTDAEAYWSLVLCRYGIEYVEDPQTKKRVPTVNRAQYTSVFDDEDYRKALECGDMEQKRLYQEEAQTINEIQKGILEISNQEEPFDVFICYKETDQQGRRTQDSVIATELYHELTKEGFKVFFARITLEDKLGSAYEPYIFAALNSARVMVVLGTKAEFFQAVWVRNEWSRYLGMIKNGAKKMLIPAYRDMDPYDLPEEFSHLQAQDMGKLGFMQDLIHGIRKIIAVDAPQTAGKETVAAAETGNSEGTAPLLKRAYMFLEDEDWEAADQYCDRVLDLEPENAEAYLGKVLMELKLSHIEDLQYHIKVKNKNYTLKEFQEFRLPPGEDGLKLLSAIKYQDVNYMQNKNYIKAKSFASDKLREKMEEMEKIWKEEDRQRRHQMEINERERQKRQEEHKQEEVKEVERKFFRKVLLWIGIIVFIIIWAFLCDI